MNQLTNEEREKVFAMYWRCGVLDVLTDTPTTMTGINGKEQLLQFEVEDEWDYSPIKKFRLILKRLSNISDEDAVEVAKIVSGELNADFVVHRFDKGEYWMYVFEKNTNREVRIFFDKASIGHCNVYQTSVTRLDGNYLAAYDFLREKGYALPYKGQSLFELGIAIENK